MTAAGYEAEPILGNLIRVWAPCECNLTLNPRTGETVLTVCQTDACDFSYGAAKDAIFEMLVDLGQVKLLPETTNA